MRVVYYNKGKIYKQESNQTVKELYPEQNPLAQKITGKTYRLPTKKYDLPVLYESYLTEDTYELYFEVESVSALEEVAEKNELPSPLNAKLTMELIRGSDRLKTDYGKVVASLKVTEGVPTVLKLYAQDDEVYSLETVKKTNSKGVAETFELKTTMEVVGEETWKGNSWWNYKSKTCKLLLTETATDLLFNKKSDVKQEGPLPLLLKLDGARKGLVFIVEDQEDLNELADYYGCEAPQFAGKPFNGNAFEFPFGAVWLALYENEELFMLERE